MSANRDPGTLLWGVVLLIVGVAFLLSNLGLLPAILWEQWGPILLIVIGLVLVFRRSTVTLSRSEALLGPRRPEGPATTEDPATPVTSRIRLRARGSMAGIILIGIGVAFLLEEQLGAGAFPAVILIAIGVAILLR